jgi:hypothetical protein
VISEFLNFCLLSLRVFYITLNYSDPDYSGVCAGEGQIRRLKPLLSKGFSVLTRLNTAINIQTYERSMAVIILKGQKVIGKNLELKECRQGSPGFDPKFYLEKYPDVAKAYKNSCEGAMSHWIKFGIKEGRRGAP